MSNGSVTQHWVTQRAKPRLLGRSQVVPAWMRRIDLVLIGAFLTLGLFGLLMIYSATRNDAGLFSGSNVAARQGIWLGLGSILMALTALVDYRRIRRISGILYGAMLVPLLLVLTPLGSSSKGAQAWFQVAGFQIQPSEYAKLALIVSLSAYLSRQRYPLLFRHVVVVICAALIPIGLIELQPDLGTILVFGVIAFGMLVVGGAPVRAIIALLLAVVATAFLVFQLGVLKQYQLDRLGAFLDPNSGVAGPAYNLNQSKIAIGSGGITGKGLFLGSQTNLRYVPEQHTDFIFTVVGEELGLLGSFTLLVLFAVLIGRIWIAASRAPDAFGRLICVGVLVMFVFQIFENIGMTMGIMPITGIPLPLVSYGGSSLLVSCIAVGLVLNVHLRSEG